MIDLSKNWTGEDVRRLLEQHDLSQNRLSAMLSLRVMTINSWMTDKVVPSRIASIALTYIAHDLAGELQIRKKKR